MATLVLTTVGTALAGPVGGLVGALAGRSLDAAIFGTHAQRTVEGGRLTDLAVQSSAYGQSLPWVYGTTRLSGNVIWSTGLKETRHEEAETVGGKGSKQTVTSVTYTYSASFAIAISGRPIYDVGRIWADGKLLRDAAGRLAVSGQMRIYTGSEHQMPDPLIEASDGMSNVSAHRGLAYVVFEDLELAEYANRIPNLTFEVIADQGGDIDLGDIVADLCWRSALASVDTQGLKARLPGFVVAGQDSARTVLEQLAGVYGFDVVERDGVLVFRDLERPSDMTIAATRLARGAPGEGGGIYRRRRLQEMDLPREVTLSYYDVARDYQGGVQRARRQTVLSDRVVRYSLPAILSAATAKTLTEDLLDRGWRYRDRSVFALPPAYAELAPGDVVTVSDGALSQKILLEEIEDNGARLECRGVMVSGAASVHTVQADSGVVPPQQVVPLADSRMILMDMPIITGEDITSPLLFCAGNARTPGRWPGMTVLTSRDQAQSFSRLAASATPAVTGRVENVLSPGPATYWDEASELLVRLDHVTDGLESLTPEAVLNGGNIAWVGGEVVQFRTAEQVEADLYRLTGLLRARRGTEDYLSIHVAGEVFVLLQAATVIALPLYLADRGRGLTFRAVTFGQVADGVPVETLTPGLRSLMPFAPVHAQGYRDGSGNLTVRWIRRGRIGGEWQDGADVPLGETYEKYEVDILRNGGVQRTLAAGTTEITYPAALQQADFGDLPASVQMRIYQLSDTVGRGLPLPVTL
ncbi:phage tail protein [Luteithermobacter gelatinilyticus]|uniref:phage tail protein n=1 Tax=Luteithermobacter gelatinilyticus TaxID=2582913 RepID=UPI00143DAD7F|nr:phage tail protein [Luteithermobacter gelatinilyticus]